MKKAAPAAPAPPAPLPAEDAPTARDLVDATEAACERALRQVRARGREVEDEITQAVADARASGLSWHRIGLCFDLTAEGARRRWGRG